MSSESSDLEKFKNEDDIEWWRPSKDDNYNLEKKLFRTGCRPIQRKYIECTRNSINDFKKCGNLADELKKCNNLLSYLYQTRQSLDSE